MRKALIAGAQTACGLTIAGLGLFGTITEEPYVYLAPMVGAGLAVDGCRGLWALRSRQK
ncbi:hypothetical protein [Streptomyces sp. 4F14]|uniref:hypothetical protein n=1 Tax=Streptomyces sp. 4F14 TaxID=3394380 RepID=UPI003A8910CE